MEVTIGDTVVYEGRSWIISKNDSHKFSNMSIFMHRINTDNNCIDGVWMDKWHARGIIRKEPGRTVLLERYGKMEKDAFKWSGGDFMFSGTSHVVSYEVAPEDFGYVNNTYITVTGDTGNFTNYIINEG